MDYVKYVLNILAVLFIVMVITKIWMVIAKYISEQFGIGKFFCKLIMKIRKRRTGIKS